MSSPEEPATITIPVPAIPPFGTGMTADMVKDLLDIFVRLGFDSGRAGWETRALGAVLRAVYEGLSAAEGES